MNLTIKAGLFFYAGFFVAGVSGAEPGAWSGFARSHAGTVWLAGNELSSDDQAMSHRIALDVAGPSWPVAISLGAGRTDNNQESFGLPLLRRANEVTESEFNIGLSKMWRSDSRFRLYTGGGFAHIHGRFYRRALSRAEFNSGAGNGFWAALGGFAILDRHYAVGLETYYSRAKASAFNEGIRLGGTQLTALVGYVW